MKRTTHSDLATLLLELEAKLRLVPVEGGRPLVSDPNSRRLVTDAARILVEQDEKIAEMTIKLREATYG